MGNNLLVKIKFSSWDFATSKYSYALSSEKRRDVLTENDRDLLIMPVEWGPKKALNLCIYLLPMEFRVLSIQSRAETDTRRRKLEKKLSDLTAARVGRRVLNFVSPH